MQSSKVRSLQDIINSAMRVSRRSPDDRANIGCAIFDNNCELMAVGWNAKPSHSKNFKTCVDPSTNMSCHDLLHAEVRTIINAGREGCKGNYMFITNAPCMRCAGPIAEVGLKHVFYVYDHDDGIGVELLRNDYGVECTRLSSFNDIANILKNMT